MVSGKKETDGIKESKMRIGIDARMLGASGIGRYLKNLLIELQKLDSGNEYFVFLLKKDINQIKLSGNFYPVVANFTWYSFEEQIRLPVLLNKYKPDLVHFPHFNVPLCYFGKYVVTIHDLTHEDFKMYQASAHNRVYYEIKHQLHRMVILSALKRAKKVFTPSRFVKGEITKRYGVDPSKILVTPEAADESLCLLASSLTAKQCDEALEKLTVKRPYIFYVGNAHPHKNVEGLIRSFTKLKKNHQSLRLVLSGREDFFWQRIKKELAREGLKDVVVTGFVSDKELAALYKNAQALVFPSFSEGFGIPVLEAMACGCPVVSSNKTSLPEVAGEAAVYFDPKRVDDMAEKINLVLGSPKLRKELVGKGLRRLRQFSWQKMARQTWEEYLKCA